MLFAGGCSSRQSVVIGIDKNAAPLSSVDSDGNAEGFVVDMAREAGKRMGLQITFKYVDMKSGAKNFTSQGVDALWGNIVPNSKNASTMLFTKPYMSDSQKYIIKQDSKVKNISDLIGKSIGAVDQSAAYEAIKATVSPVTFKEPVSAFMALDSAKVTALAIDASYANNRMMQHAGQYSFLGDSIKNENYAVAVRRNDSKLRDMFEKALESMKRDGTSTALSKNWFGKDMTVK